MLYWQRAALPPLSQPALSVCRENILISPHSYPCETAPSSAHNYSEVESQNWSNKHRRTPKACSNWQKNQQKYLEQCCSFHNGDKDTFTFSNSCRAVEYEEAHKKYKASQSLKGLLKIPYASLSALSPSLPAKRRQPEELFMKQGLFLKAPAIFSI